MAVSGASSKVPVNLDLWGSGSQSIIDQGKNGGTGASTAGTSTSGGRAPAQSQKEANADAMADAMNMSMFMPDPTKLSVFLNPNFEVNVSGQPDPYASARRKGAQSLAKFYGGAYGSGSGSSSSVDKPSGLNASNLRLQNGGITV